MGRWLSLLYPLRCFHRPCKYSYLLEGMGCSNCCVAGPDTILPVDKDAKFVEKYSKETFSSSLDVQNWLSRLSCYTDFSKKPRCTNGLGQKSRYNILLFERVRTRVFAKVGITRRIFPFQFFLYNSNFAPCWIWYYQFTKWLFFRFVWKYCNFLLGFLESISC